MKILVTGGAGFIGSHIVEHFQGRAEVRVLDNLRSGFKHNLAGFKHEFIAASILDRAAVRRAMEGVDFVFHLAAMVSVPESMAKPVECNEINAAGTLVVLEEAARAGVKKLVFSSSAAIYGDNPVMPKIETMPPEPKSPYAITKLDGEFYCKCSPTKAACPPPACATSTSSDRARTPKASMPPPCRSSLTAPSKNLPITIFGDGEQTRDFIYVKDIVAANVFFATQSQATGVFNVAYGRKITIDELAQQFARAHRLEFAISPTRRNARAT